MRDFKELHNAESIGSTVLYQCPECGLYYKAEATAQKCQAWCKEHKSCNLEITKLSIGNQRLQNERRVNNGPR